MSLSACLVRFLLALTLAVGGVGNAYAGASMALMQADAAPAPSRDAQAADAAATEDCEHAAMPGQGDQARPGVDLDDGQAAADCCEGETCRAACAHGHAAAVVAAVRTLPPQGAATAIAARSHFQPAPALPRLNRPPIG